MLTVILHHPQMGENIGAAARAMMNFGLSDLRLVAPRDGWPNERAQAMSSGALDAMSSVQVFSTLPEALADLQFVLATTARPRDIVKPIFSPETAAQEISRRAGQSIGLLFGAERTGLLNDDIALAHGIITIPTNPDFPALNLAQSVLLMAHELSKLENTPSSSKQDNPPAPHAELENFLTRLETELEETQAFFRSPAMAPTMKRNLRAIFTRSDLTAQELKTLHGVLTALRSK